MPKWLEDKLIKQGRKRGLTGDALEGYVYGTMNKLGYMKGNKRTKKGKKKKKKH